MAAKKDPAASRESKTVKRKPMKSSEERNLLKTIEDFLHFDEQSLREQGVLVQREMNKKLIKFPLKNGKFVTVKSGSLMTFFKFGNLIALKKSNKMFELLIDQDHIEAVFKDFSPEQLKRNESSKRNSAYCEGTSTYISYMRELPTTRINTIFVCAKARVTAFFYWTLGHLIL